MDADRIELVLAKTSELRSKIINCIHTTTCSNGDTQVVKESEANPDEEEAEILLNIKDALENLEGQLSSLQALQQQQWYEKEAALAEIEYSQKKLLKELKEYKGKDLEVIHEAISFASETEETNDLLLPPYPSRPSQPIVQENGYLQSFPPTRKFTQNGTISYHESQRHDQIRNGPLQRIKSLIGTTAKAALTVVGVIAILSLAGYEPRLRKRGDDPFKLLDFFHLQMDKNKVECPPGKVPVIENGEMRCVVKERVEVPFESVVVATPNVSYGCG